MDPKEKEVLALLLEKKERKKQIKRRKCKVRDIVRKRDKCGIFTNPVNELKLGDREYYFK